MKKILLFLLFSISFYLPAQNYQNICSGGTTFFKDNYSFLKAFRRDSVYLSGNIDSVFISYTTIRDSSIYTEICKDTTNGDVLGRKIIRKQDGWFCFFNYQRDTIKINTQAALNQAWRYCNLPGGSYIEAKVTEIMNDTILGITDQVKIISFQARNSSGTAIDNIFNQKKIKLSLHYGLSEIYDIYSTPYDTLHYILAGKTSPPIGIQPISWQDVYNFDVGDEFHYSGYDKINWFGPTWKTIKRILGKTVYGNNDSVVYQIEYCQTKSIPYPPPHYENTFDTVNEKYNFIEMANDLIIQRLPDEFTRSQLYYDWIAPSFSRKIGSFYARPVQIYCDWRYSYDGQCFTDPFEAGSTIINYTSGLGKTSSFSMWEESVGFNHHISNELVYYKKGSESWGTPVSTDCNTLVDVHSVTAKTNPFVRIIPNPVETQGTIIVDNYFPGKNLQFDVYNCLGKKVICSQVTSSFSTFLREGLPPGLYLYTVTIENGKLVGRGKLILK